MGRSELADDPRYATAAARLERRRELDELVAEYTRGREELDLQAFLQGAGVPVHRVQNSKECLADPQLIHREHFVTVPHAMLGPIIIEGTRLKLSRSEDAVKYPGPMMGEHNEYVLREILGYDDERIMEIVAADILS
jgi:crotonobetainyl-CoA:carnitine CoA-transferase CaiB-like acyl-CoA transferase